VGDFPGAQLRDSRHTPKSGFSHDGTSFVLIRRSLEPNRLKNPPLQTKGGLQSFYDVGRKIFRKGNFRTWKQLAFDRGEYSG
jgi:hypothetical protein